MVWEGTQGQNMRPNRLSHLYIKSSMNTVLFVNATVGFSENHNATIEYSSESVCVCMCVFLHDNSKSNQCSNMKFKYVVVYEYISDKFDNGHCRIKVNNTNYQVL